MNAEGLQLRHWSLTGWATYVTWRGVVRQLPGRHMPSTDARQLWLHNRDQLSLPLCRFKTHPYVVGLPHLRFYAGAPLISSRGHRLGSLQVPLPAGTPSCACTHIPAEIHLGGAKGRYWKHLPAQCTRASMLWRPRHLPRQRTWPAAAGGGRARGVPERSR